jgi:capsular exopolysaccharide synthesis family protein
MNTKKPDYITPDSESRQFFDDNIDIKRFVSLFISNWYWFAISLFISVSIAYGVNRWSEEIYTVTSSLLIKSDQTQSLSEIFPNSDGYKNQQNLNNEIGILKSYDLNRKVIAQLPDFLVDYVAVGKRGIAEKRLYKASPFIVTYDSIGKQKFYQKIYIKILSDQKYNLVIEGDKDFSKDLQFDERFNIYGFDFSIKLRNKKEFKFSSEASNRYYFYFNNPDHLANIYRSKLSINPVEADASLVTLTTSGLVQAQEADYLNKLMDVYLDYGLAYKNQTASQSIDFIEDQLKTISDSLKIAEKDIESFRLANRFMYISQEGTMIQNKLEKIDAEKTTLLLQKRYYEYLKGYIDSKNENDDIIAPSIMGVTDQLLIGYIEQLSQLQKQKKQITLNFFEKTEPQSILEENISAIRSAMRENIIDGIKNIESSLSDIESRLSETEYEIRRLPSVERNMINIQRKFDINNSVYTFLLEKRAEAGITKASNISDNRIIDKAGFFSSARIKPKEKQNIFIALIFGFMFPVLGILFLDYLNNKVMDKKDIEKGTGTPIIGYINHNDSNKEVPVVENPGSVLSESFRSIRTTLKYFVRDNKCPVIAISSTITGEGKTFISVNLASIIALTNKKVLLIGLDLRKPRIHKMLGFGNEPGMSSYLIGHSKFDDVIIKTDIGNLWYAPAGQIPPNPAELIESASMTRFIDEAKEKFDIIIIDTPPVAIVTDAILVSSFTDFYLFVVRQRYTTKNTLELIEGLRNSENIKGMGIIINDISLSGYYGYGLRYGYSTGYGYSFGYNYYGYRKYGYKDLNDNYYTEG